ncbi:hypothetical protein Esti_001602 [Eimeria stiedai]
MRMISTFRDSKSYWEECWKPCWWPPPLPVRGLAAPQAQWVPLSPLSSTSEIPDTCTCGPMRATSMPNVAPRQKHRHTNREADEKATGRLTEGDAYWALQGGGFCRAGAKVPGSQHQQQQQLRHRCSTRRDVTAAAATAKTPTPAAAPTYPTTDVPASRGPPIAAAAIASVAAEGSLAQPTAVGCTFTAATKVMTFVSKQQDDLLLQSAGSIDPKALTPLAGSKVPAAKQRLIDSSILEATACDSKVEGAVAAATGSVASGPARGMNQQRQEEARRRYAREPPPFARLHRNQMKRLTEGILHKQKTTVVKPFTFSATQQRAEERERAREQADLADRRSAQLAYQRSPPSEKNPSVSRGQHAS